MIGSPLGPLCCFVFIWISRFFPLVSSLLLSDEITFSHSRAHLWIGSCLKQEENRQKKEKQHFCYVSIISCIYTHITAVYLAAFSVWARKEWESGVNLMLCSVHSMECSSDTSPSWFRPLHHSQHQGHCLSAVCPLLFVQSLFLRPTAPASTTTALFKIPFSANLDFWHLNMIFIINFVFIPYRKLHVWRTVSPHWVLHL